MICRSRLGIASLLALALVAARSAADDPPPAPLVLFDGKTLDGWKKTPFFKAAEAEVVVSEGAIVLPQGAPMSGITSTRADLPTVDYELTYEARRTAGADFFAAATFPVGASFVTLVNGGWGGSVTGLSNLNGMDASENATNKFFKYQNQAWYRFRVRVTAKAIRGSVDDREVFAVDHSDVQLKTRLETRPCQPLGFATWKSAGAIRKVEVRKLTPAEVAAVDRLD